MFWGNAPDGQRGVQRVVNGNCNGWETGSQAVQQVVSHSQEHHGPRTQDRRDRIPRPQVDEGISQSDWNFFSSQWSHYIKGTGLVGESMVLHLWEACSELLQRSLHHAGAGSEENADALMSTIKTLAVKKHNNLVNIIELQRSP